MMIKALLFGESKNLLEENSERREYFKGNKDHFICPICLEHVTLHWAKEPKKAPHFKHTRKSTCINSISESIDHQKGKEALYNYVLHHFSHKTRTIDVEHYIPETKQIADIYIEFTNGVKWVIEYQRSNISPEELQNRRALYKKVGITDIWIIGENNVSAEGFNYNIKNIGQALIKNTPFGTQSLITYDPLSDEVSLYRGLHRINSKLFTVDDGAYTSTLNDICFNLKGDAFCYGDYSQYVEPVLPINVFPFYMTNQTLYKSELPNYIVKVKIKSQQSITNEGTVRHLNLPPKLLNYIPVEMRHIDIKACQVSETSNPHERNSIQVQGLYNHKWANWEGDKSTESTNIEDDSVVQGFLYWELLKMYNDKFKTEAESYQEMDITFSGDHSTTFSENNKLLKKYGLINKSFLPQNLKEPIALEECLEMLLTLVPVKLNEESNVIDIAQKMGIIEIEDSERIFTYERLKKITKKISDQIPVSPNYCYGEISEDSWKKLEKRHYHFFKEHHLL